MASTNVNVEEGGIMMIRKTSYQRDIGRAYNKGAVYALLKIGKSCSEIASILDLEESHVRNLDDSIDVSEKIEKLI